MTKSLCTHEFDEVCRLLDRLSHDAGEMTIKAFDGLLRHSRASLEDAEKLGRDIDSMAKEVTVRVLAAKEDSKILPAATIVEMVNELEKIKYSLDKIIANIRSKVDEGVLFSDKAMSELKDFFMAAQDGLNTVHDLILTRNPVLISHIIKKAETYEEIGRKYADEHQERLIKGICLPKSSLIYLLILDGLKDILRFLKTIAFSFKEE